MIPVPGNNTERRFTMFNEESIMQPEVEVEYEAVAEFEPEVVETVGGHVVDCARLNIRSAPDKGAEVLCVVPAGAVLLVDMILVTRDWYKVCTEAGIEGYCMKKYVDIGQ